MVRIPFDILGKRYYLRSYNTFQEKDVLLLQQLQENDFYHCIDECLRIFGFEEDNNTKIYELSLKEKKLLLYLYRGISVGDECQLLYECKSCHQVTNNKITFNFNDMLKGYDGLRILDEKPSEENLHKFISNDYLNEYGVNDFDDLDIDDYDFLSNKIREVNEIFNFHKSLKCQECQKTEFVDCSQPKFILEHLSEVDLLILYDSITYLVTLGYTKTDIDNLYPFERSILIDQMTKHLEEQNE